MEELLAPLSRDELQALLLVLAEQQPGLTELIKAHILALRNPAGPAVAAPQPDLPPFDPVALRKQVHATFGSVKFRRGYIYEAAAEIVDRFCQIARQARPYLEAGDGRAALTILEAVGAELTARLDSLPDEDGNVSRQCEEIWTLLTEVLLTADLSSEERAEWEKRIEDWEARAADHGMDEALAAARYAARQGWDHPPLQRVLAGEITEEGVWEGEAPYCAGELAEIRLKLLERQGNWEEYLHLAKAENRIERYVMALVRLGRIEEAVEYGLTRLSGRKEALTLARALDSAGAAEQALRVVEHALATTDAGPYPSGELPAWTRDLAIRLARTDRALSAALAAIQERPDLANYQAVSSLAGEGWPEVREKLLKQLRGKQSYHPSDEVDIFLHEGLIEEAMAAVDASPRHALVERVAEAALDTHPDWVFRACAHQFDRIADARKSQYYREAIYWLGKAKDALYAAGREAEWPAYVGDVIARHSRKHGLRPALERLR